MDLRKRPCKRNKNKGIMMATWKVLLSLNRPGALAKFKDELNKYRIAITAVQELGGVERKCLNLEIL